MSSQKEFPAVDAGIVPVEGPANPARVGTVRSSAIQRDATANAGSLGPNNEQLPDKLQEALRRLVYQFSTESESTRRQEVRRIKQAHQFWRGLQYLWWNEQDQNWHLPFEQKLADGSSIEDLPRYEFVTNIYQAFGLSLVSVLSQDVPRVRFFPSSAQAEEDVAAAKAATEVAALVERNNRVGNLIVDEAFQLWTDGKVGAYVRFVVDGQRFGFHPETEIGAREVRVGGDVYVCPECSAETPADGAQAGSSSTLTEKQEQIPRTASRAAENHRQSKSARDSARDDNASGVAKGEVGENLNRRQDAGAANYDNQKQVPHSVRDDSVKNMGGTPSPQCNFCGALLTEEDFVAAENITVPSAQTRLRVPNGQEVITIVGGLELKTPPWANEMHEYPYLQWNLEVHQARLRAAYPHAADKIGSPVAPGSQQYERLARLSQSQGGPVTEGGDSNMNLITFQRTWLRPWAFFALEDKPLRDELLQMFPDGAYVAFAGDAYCESRNENMDDHWRVLHALPGDGSSGRPALGDALISVQERFNTLSNLQMETYEYGIPPIYADSEVLDFDALQSQSSEPGAHYPARAKPGQSLAAGFFQPEAAEVPGDLSEHAANLMGPIAQFLTGAFPALFGGAMSNNDTASGYAMARDQAMGRIGLVWRRMKFFHADIMLLAVDCFRRNRPNDVEVTLLGAGAAFESQWIRLADLKGNLFSYPETDEQYPTLWSQQRAVLLQLIANPDPQIQAVLAHPENMALVKRLIGLEEFVIPDEESRTKQYREIAQLVAEMPLVKRQDVTGAVNPAFQDAIASGVDAEIILPSIMPDEFADNHAVELEICMRWFSADAGQVAKVEAPLGYANVRAHALFHRDFLRKQQAAATPPPPATSAPRRK
ncbi:MAG: hypothetical protein ABSB65_07125 [Candidatus Acidiferrales bacterium]